MKLILSENHELTLSKEQSRDFQDEMRFACREVSVFPVMEEVLRLMEA